MNHRRILASLVLCLMTWVIAAESVYSQNPTVPPAEQRGTRPENPPTVPPTNERALPSSNPSTANESNAFLTQAIESNTAEVQLGRLAATKAQNQRVKTYADMLVKDHSAALEKLQRLQPGTRTGQTANPKPSSDHENLRSRLSGLSGAQFDREFIDAMIAAHRKAVGLFERQIGPATAAGRDSAAGRGNNANRDKAATGSASPTEVTALARELLPTIKHHLEQAEQMQKTLAAPAK